MATKQTGVRFLGNAGADRTEFERVGQEVRASFPKPQASGNFPNAKLFISGAFKLRQLVFRDS